MREHKRQISWNLAAFCLLFLVSVYRQIDLRFLHNGILCNCIVFFSYIVLILGWSLSLIGRITQRFLLYCLLFEALLMMTGLTIRFLQDSFFYRNMQLMRSSGLVIGATLLPLLLLGVFAAMGMGQPDQYRIPKFCLLLLIPVLLMDILLIRDDLFHIIFRILENEPQPNLYFHPGWGLWLFVLMLAILVFLRVVIIFRRNHNMDQHPRIRLLLSMAEIVILLLYMIPYFVTSLYGTPEIIETYAMLYYIEALTWELYICFGLVPANTAWGDVFSKSTLDMQILPTDGSPAILSSKADPIPDSLMTLLNKSQTVSLPDGRDLHSYLIPDADVIFRRDTRLLKQTLNELDQLVDSLEQESDLLARELQTENKQVRLQERENIYSNLRQSVSSQLERMEQLIAENFSGMDSVQRLRILCILGTYVKRKCNLLLYRESHGDFNPEDIILSINDLLQSCKHAGIDIHYVDEGSFYLDRTRLFEAFELLEEKMEDYNFEISRITFQCLEDKILLSVLPKGGEDDI